jgi:putative effector of murein hydrolase LrgA (UPF0299 family)
MKTQKLLRGAVILVASFALGTLAGSAPGSPFPAALVGVALALLALRVGVIVEAVEDGAPPPPARPFRPAGGRAPALRAANG